MSILPQSAKRTAPSGREPEPLTPYEEAMRNVDRIIAELDKELKACTTQATTAKA